MKHIIIGVCSCVLLGLILLTIATLHGRSIRKAELENALTSSVDQTLAYLEQDNGQVIDSNKAMIGVFLQNFLTQLQSQSQVTIHILDADYQKGLLSVEAVLTYQHPTGQKGTVAACRTAILEEGQEQSSGSYCRIQYFVEGTVYKTYNVKQGCTIMLPETPQKQGKVFVGWRELQEEQIMPLAGQIVDRSLSLVAVFQ